MIRNERGAAGVETAVVLPILLMLVFGIVEYGKYFFDVHQYQEAVTTAVRAAAMEENVANKESVATTAVQNVLTQMGLSLSPSMVIDVTTNVNVGVAGKTATQVAISVTYTPIVSFAQVALPSQINVVASHLDY